MVNIRDIETYRENNQLEAKKAAGGLPGSLWETYSSFANTDGGVILLGVEERTDGSLEVTGVQDPEHMKKDFWNTISSKQEVSVNILTDRDVTTEDFEGKKIIVIRVPRADRYLRPVFIGNNPQTGSYRRRHDGDYHCTPLELAAMYRDSYPVTPDAHLIRRRGLEVFCMDTVHKYRSNFKMVHPNHVWATLEDEEFLIKIGAMGFDSDDARFYPTGAGLLMFGCVDTIAQEYPAYLLDYQDISAPGSRWVDRLTSSGGEWSGNLFDFFFAVSDKLTFNLPRPFSLKGLFRVDDTPLHKAVREALLNTLVNADYSASRGVVVRKNKNGFIFENPGNFRISIKEAMGGGISDPRNIILFKMFMLIGLGERAGSGIPAIVDGWEKAYGERPVWTDSHNPDRTTLTLHCRNFDDVLFRKDTDEADSTIKSVGNSGANQSVNSETVGNSEAKPLVNSETVGNSEAKPLVNSKTVGNSDVKPSVNSETVSIDLTENKVYRNQQKIISYLSRHGLSSSSEISEALSISATQIRHYLKQFINEGKIEAIGTYRDRRYRLIPD